MMVKIAEKENYKPRIIDKMVDRYLNIFGAICIEGPKWCGKSWTSSYHANSEFLLADSTRNFQNKQLAEISPSFALEGDTPRLIDEWQEVPSLWDAVRFEVDKRGKKGQFILTGSSTPRIKGILHSGAGRIGRLRMRTMSLYESGDSTGQVSLKNLCEGKLEEKLTGEVNLLSLADYIVRGGFPGAIDMSINDSRVLTKSYIDSILHSDVKRIDGKKYDINKMELLLKSLARNESTTATKSKLANDIKDFDKQVIDYDTVSIYLDLFERLFLLDNQKPYSTNGRSSIRVKQSSKLHFCDPSLTCTILDLTPEKLINDLETFGFLFEALCERDLKIYAESFDAKVYHYQNYLNQEIDAAIELNDGNWCAFEIELGAHQIDKAAENLLNIKNKIIEKGGKAPSILCVICGLTNAAYKRKDGVFVVPITALKD